MTFERRGEHHGLDTLFYRLSAGDWRAPPGRRPASRPRRRAVAAVADAAAGRLPAARRGVRPSRSIAAITRYLLAALHRPSRRRRSCSSRSGRRGSRAAWRWSPRRPTTSPTSAHPHVETLAVRRGDAGTGRGAGAARRRRGRGRATRGHDFITLNVFDANRRARAVYERRGYLAETVTIASRWIASRAGGPREHARVAPDGLVVRRDAPADADALWAILQAVIAAGETYAYARDMTRDDALSAWHPAGGHTFVAELDGRLAGTYLLKANQPGPRQPRRQLRLHGGAEARGQGHGRGAVPALAGRGARRSASARCSSTRS